jgi:succinyl-CoA synthetase beta subunit
MILYEFEGKKILHRAGIPVPTSQLLSSPADQVGLQYPVVLKAQVLSGKRKDAGGILFSENDLDTRDKIQNLFGAEINKEKVEKILVEEKIPIEAEYYLALSYDTDLRAPIMTFSEAGGTGIEDRGVQVFPIDPVTKSVGQSSNKLRDSSASLQNDKLSLPEDLVSKLINLFFEIDATLLEINPLIKTKSGEYMALDAKIKLDDSAQGRHPEWKFPPRSAPGHTPTQREIEAKKIDEGDYKGVAGSAFFDIDGDIAVMSSGGGASLTAMDALIKNGGKPANYTEYSGNPSKEKVQKLTKVVLSKPDLHGLWIVGAVANFTDVYETLSGIIEGLRETEKELGRKFDFPIVIRRGGPRDKEAFEMLRQVKDFDLHLYGEETSISQSAEIMARLAKEYSQKGALSS